MRARSFVPADAGCDAATREWYSHRDAERALLRSKYVIMGFISSGTYGKVYKARLREPTADDDPGALYAIKKFKPEKEGERTYVGLSQSAMREIALCRELRHENLVGMREVILEGAAVHLVFTYAEHDLLQIIHYHATVLRQPIPVRTVKSIMYQMLQGVAYLHANWVLHRDLKPANVLVTADGQVKIGDLGLARICHQPLTALYAADKVVVTIYYRSPELLLGTRHYTPAIDVWSVGCILGELVALRPMFKGEEAKMDPKTKAVPFQKDQLDRITEVLGPFTKEDWPMFEAMPDARLWQAHAGRKAAGETMRGGKRLAMWYGSRVRGSYRNVTAAALAAALDGVRLLEALLIYDPLRRVTAEQALRFSWFTEPPEAEENSFELGRKYPVRRLQVDETDVKMAAEAVPDATSSAPASASEAVNSSDAASIVAAATTTLLQNYSSTSNPSVSKPPTSALPYPDKQGLVLSSDDDEPLLASLPAKRRRL